MKTLATIHSPLLSTKSPIRAFLPEKEPTLAAARRIPVCEPNISKKEIRYVSQAISSAWISSSGDFVSRFESAFARTVSKTKFAVAVNSGTSALHTALTSLGIGPGDEVILPVFTMIATANAVMYCGATPVFVDADPVTWNMQTTCIEPKITKKTKAIIAVHTYGSPVNMGEILKLAKKHYLWVVEDAAESHGAQYNGIPVGSIGDVSAFSLYANKVITTGEGGVVASNNPDIAQRLRLLANHAFSEERHFWHTMIGFGYRMSNLQAALGLAQVERFKTLLQLKRKHAELYRSRLRSISGITLPVETLRTTHTYWMFGVCINEHLFGMTKNELRTYLAANGIETRSFFVPIHVQPPYYGQFGHEHYPIAESLCENGLYLPSSTTLSHKDILFVCDVIQHAYQRGKRI